MTLENPSMAVPNAHPLRERTILIAASTKILPSLKQGLEALGADVLSLEAIQVRGMDHSPLLDDALRRLSEFDWLVFTSAYSVSFFADRMRRLSANTRRLKFPRICAIGPGTAAAAAKLGMCPDLVARTFTGEGIFEALLEFQDAGEPGLRGLRILIPRALEAREFLPAALLDAGARVEVVPCYQAVRGTASDALLRRVREKRLDMLVFTSASTIRNMIEILGPKDGRALLCSVPVAVIGPITGKAAESFGKCPEVTPKESTVPSLVEAIGAYFVRTAFFPESV